MANFSLGEAVLGTVMDLAGLRKGMGQAEGESKSLWGKIGAIGEKALGTLTGNIATKGFDALLGAVQSVGDTLLNEAPRVEQLRASFDNLSTSAGLSGDEIMASMREASKGMVTDVSLMESFNKSMLLVGEGMATKLPKLMEIAQASAAATGQDVGFLLDSLVTGIGRGSPMILDNLGLTINLAEAYEGYAKTLGVTADELTKAQQQEALLNAVMASGDEFIQRLGDNTGGTAQTLAQFKTTIENLKMGLATGLLPALTAIVTPLADLAMEHLPKLIPLAERFGEVFGAFIKVVLSGSNPLTSFVSMLAMLGVPPEIVSGIKAVTVAIAAVSAFVTGSVIPAVQQLATWFTTSVVPAVQQVASWFQTVLFPALEQVWAFVQNNQLPLFMALADLLKTTLTLAVTALAGIWQNVLLPALQKAGAWISDTFGPVLETFVGWLGKVTGGAEGISSAFEKVIGWVQSLTEKLKTIELPKWMTPGSPTPWELGLRGIADALNEVSGAQLPQLGAGMGGLPTPALAGAGAMAGGGGISINFNGNMTLDNPQRVRDLAEEISRVLGEQLQSRRL